MENISPTVNRTQPPEQSGRSKRWRLAVASIAGWTVAGAIWASFFYIRSITAGEKGSYWEWLLTGIVVFLFWPIMFPLIRRAAERWRIERGVRVKHSVYHVLLAGLVFVIHAGWILIAVPAAYALLGMETFADYWANVHFSELFLSVRGPVDFAIYWGIVLGQYAYRYYEQYRERDLRASQLEAQLAQAQLAALRMHIQPHFLFNTLHSIVALIQQDNRTGAIRMAVGLSDLLRRVLSESDRHEATLGEELDFTRQYLEIEQTRFEDRMKVTMDIDPDTEKAYVPTLLLQPLVENAIRHGIARKTGPGIISIAAKHDHETLLITVVDNGAGLGDKSSSTGQGVGLRVTRERLQKIYGDRFELRLEDGDGGGTRAVIRLPFSIEPTQNGETGERSYND